MSQEARSGITKRRRKRDVMRATQHTHQDRGDTAMTADPFETNVLELSRFRSPTMNEYTREIIEICAEGEHEVKCLLEKQGAKRLQSTQVRHTLEDTHTPGFLPHNRSNVINGSLSMNKLVTEDRLLCETALLYLTQIQKDETRGSGGEFDTKLEKMHRKILGILRQLKGIAAKNAFPEPGIVGTDVMPDNFRNMTSTMERAKRDFVFVRDLGVMFSGMKTDYQLLRTNLPAPAIDS